MIVHEDVKTLGIGAEVVGAHNEERFDHLDAPVQRVTYPDTHCPFSQVLEQACLPNADTIYGGAEATGRLLTWTRPRATPRPAARSSWLFGPRGHHGRRPADRRDRRLSRPDDVPAIGVYVCRWATRCDHSRSPRSLMSRCSRSRSAAVCGAGPQPCWRS